MMYATSKETETMRVHSTTDTDADTAMIVTWLVEIGELLFVVWGELFFVVWYVIMSVNI